MLINRLLVIGTLLLGALSAAGQRNYSQHSVLATGTWGKLTISKPGVYRLDLSFLASIGINASNLPSGSIRLFGNGGHMLSEANNGPWMDDLVENAILVMDGGDGVLNENDYILFYAPGPHQWQKDSANAAFLFKKNLYTDVATYFVTAGGNGLRVSPAPAMVPSPTIVTTYTGRYFHELDTINFLGSGKEWYGEEFADAPGKTLVRNFTLNTPGLILGSPMNLRSHFAARSVGNGSRFSIQLNNQPAGEIGINPVSGGQYDPIAQETIFTTNAIAGNNNINLQYQFLPGSFNAQGWLNRFELFTRQTLSFPGNEQLLFRDWSGIGPAPLTFQIANAGNATQVWDVTEPLRPVSLPVTLSGSNLTFTNDASRLREYVAFEPASSFIPKAAGNLVNQDLHATTPADLIIITYPEFRPQADRLAQLHRDEDNMRVLVVTTDQVFNEFSSGIPDPVALRDFVKMYHDRYSSNVADKLKHLLLFGDASYDFKNRIGGNTNFVPTWENNFSLDPLATYASDDFFGFLDDHEDVNSGLVTNLLDIGIGRIPAANIDEAKQFVDKAESHYSNKSLGPWRQQLTFIADDEDGNLHLQDAEIITSTAHTTSPGSNLRKIYLDAYKQVTGPGGSAYPEVNQAISNQVYNGTLILNYTGHGGARRLAEETVIDQDLVNQWNNAYRLPLLITATCDFAPFDNPGIRSLGENLLLRPASGAIALMTTTRVVFAFSNRVMNDNYLRFALEPGPGGKYRSLGDAMKDAKNYTYQNSGDIANNRKFTLLGDPAITLGFPKFRLRTTRVNNLPPTQADTLMATDKVIMEGEVTDEAGNVLTGFNGTVYPSVFDKPRSIQTLANDPGSLPVSFSAQQGALFKGKASVTEGRFTFSFIVPRDINYQYGPGKLSLYADDGDRDAGGFFTNFLVGGMGNNAPPDNEGPVIKPYLNDELFVNGGLVNQDPVLILKLTDSSGINISGTGIGHELLATLDNNNDKYFILNDFYQADPDSYQSGEARFQLAGLEPGPHTIKIKAWDVLNNSSEAVLDFIVARDEELVLSHVLNYPNPFTTHTNFWFEHNRPGQDLDVSIQIFTLSGRIIKRIKKTINTIGNRSSELEWDGKDDFGDKVGRGVYFYKISVSSAGSRREKIEKLVIF